MDLLFVAKGRAYFFTTMSLVLRMRICQVLLYRVAMPVMSAFSFFFASLS